MRIVHLSDLHFGHHDAALAEGLSADVTAQGPTLVVVSGDFTQRGTRPEFEQAQRFLASLSVPFFAVPGNHDVPERNLLTRIVTPYRLYRRYVCDDLEPFLALEGVAIAGLKTSRRARFELNWSHGTISAGQVRRVERAFAAAGPDKTRVLVAHHPLLVPDHDVAVPMRPVGGASPALDALSRMNVRLVLSGHFHLSYVRSYSSDERTQAAMVKAPAGPLLLVQASSTISTRLRGEPNAYNVIDIEQGAIRVAVRQWTGGGWTTRDEVAAQS